MGRRKKESQEVPQNPSSCPVGLVDAALDLFDLLGFYGASGDLPRLSLAFHVRRLDKTRFQGLIGDAQDTSKLLVVERLLQDIRDAATLFLSSLPDERETIDESCQDLRQASELRDDLQQWSVFVDEIASKFREQSLLEEKFTSRLLLFLDDFYTDTTSSPSFSETSNVCFGSPSEFLVTVASCLRREHFFKNHTLRLASDMFSTPEHPMPSRDGKRERDNSSPSVVIEKNDPLSWSLGESPGLSENKSILELVEKFKQLPLNSTNVFMAVLLVGGEGTGKSFICDAIEKMSGSNGLVVLRPELPRDFLASSAGEAEDRFVALFNSARRSGENAIVILDDLDSLFHAGITTESYARRADLRHISLRLQTTLLALIDDARRHEHKRPNLLLVCTSKENMAQEFSRFDAVFHNDLPSAQQAKDLIAVSLGISDAKSVGQELTVIAESLVGRSFVEMSQLCREAIGECAHQDISQFSPHWTPQVLKSIKNSIHNATPLSLRNGENDNFVDMRVYTASDLHEEPSDSTISGPGLYGRDVDHAWKEIQSNIIIPLCRRRELARLVDKGSVMSDKVMCGGILLTGPSGCGKTVIAFQAARMAARLLPTVSLIDVSCTSLIHKEVGGSEQAVKKLFAAARQAAPCILLMDGIENVAATRGNDPTTEGSLDRILSTLLVEMDGIDNNHSDRTQAGISVIGITHDENWIDPALKRPYRLSRSVRLGLPHDHARLKIVERELGVYFANESGISSSLAVRIANETNGMSGASVVAACKDAMLSVANDGNFGTESVPASA